jgi:hypothetical protein
MIAYIIEEPIESLPTRSEERGAAQIHIKVQRLMGLPGTGRGRARGLAGCKLSCSRAKGRWGHLMLVSVPV